MKIKKIVKKIAALGIGASMVGATLMGAMAADLNNYPNMFITDGRFNGLFVVGANAKGEDVVGITAIATSLQNVPVQVAVTESVAQGAAERGDKGFTVTEGSELCNRDMFPQYNLSTCESGVNDADLSFLADAVYIDNQGDNDNEAGYNAEDSQVASRVVAKYLENKALLTGSEVVLVTVNENQVTRLTTTSS